MSTENSIKNVYDVLIKRLGMQTAHKQMSLLSAVISTYATMHTYPTQLCITEHEFNEFESIRTSPDKPHAMPECLPRIAFDTISVIQENNPDVPIEITLATGVNDIYTEYVFKQYKIIYDLMINEGNDDTNQD